MYIPAPPEPDTTYHFDGVVDISEGWASFSGRNYRLADIARIKISRINTQILPMWVFVYGLAMAFVMLVATLLLVSSYQLDPISGYRQYESPLLGLQPVVCVYLIGTCLALAVLTWRWRTSHKIYLLSLTGEFGRVNALASMDEGYINIVARALQKAMRDEGWI